MVTMQARANKLAAIQALPYVAAANPDAERHGGPIDTVSATDFSDGLSTWDLDAVNVTDFGLGRTAAYDGSGVYVAVIDTGLLSTWRQYFPQECIATQYARAFGGGGGEVGYVSSQPIKWERDQNSHGTHVTSTILGYSLRGTAINGVAPMASPHVAGIVALMAQKDPSLTASDAETFLEGSAFPLAPGCRTVANPSGTTDEFCWEADATGAGLATADAALAVVP